MSRPIEMCSKCKQLKPRGRDVVGWGWLVCECDAKPDAKIHLDVNVLKKAYAGPDAGALTESPDYLKPFKPVFE